MKLLSTTLALLAAVPTYAQDGNDIVIDLGRGPVIIHVPDVYESETPAPLIILLHGYTGNGAGQESYMRFLPFQEEFGFLYAHPDGLVDFWGNRYWNATDACCDFGNTNSDDSGYLRAIVDEIQVQLTVDTRRVYFVGHSNGGFMSYRMACEHSDIVAGIAGLAGATYFNPGNCNPAGPVHVLQIHGTQDTTIDYDGGNINGVPYPGALDSVLTWVGYNGCDPVPDDSSPDINLDNGIAGKETTVSKYEGSCWPAGSAELWSIQGGSHVPNLNFFFARKVIRWLYRHPKPGLDSERYCDPAVVNSSGQPARIDAAGSDALEHNDLTLTASDLPQNQFGYFLTSQTPGFVANPGGAAGNLCLGGTILRLIASLGNSGSVGSFSAGIDLTSLPGDPPTVVLSGQTWNFTAWCRDGGTSNFTDATAILFR